jgi:hypothetical protein
MKTMTYELKIRVLDVFNDHILQLRQQKDCGIESNSPQEHLKFAAAIDKEIAEATATRNEFLDCC